MKRFVIALALTCLIGASVSAGEIPSGGIAPPPPPDGIQTGSTTSPGDVPTVGYTGQLSDAALNLIQIMLGAGI